MASYSGRISGIDKRVKVDAKDRKITALLAQNSRMAASQIAKEIQLSRDAVAYRIKRLQQEGVIIGFVPILDFSHLGFSEYHVFFLLDEKVKAEHHKLVTFLKNHSSTRAVMGYTDTWDLEWTLIVRDIREFDAILTDVLTTFPEVIVEQDSLAVVRKYLSLTLPKSYSNISPKKLAMRAPFTPDKLTYKLIDLLAKDSRQSTYELGRALGISPDSVSYKLKQLQDSGIIKQFTTLYNLTALGHSWYTYTINMKHFDKHDEAKLSTYSIAHPHLIRAAKLFGPWNVMLSIVTDSPQNYHTIVKDIKNSFAHIIHKYQTWLAHEEHCYNPVPNVLSEALEPK